LEYEYSRRELRRSRVLTWFENRAEARVCSIADTLVGNWAEKRVRSIAVTLVGNCAEKRVLIHVCYP